MPERNPYREFVVGFADLLAHGTDLSLGNADLPSHPPIAEDAATVVLFSPHPDDECLTGALPLRLRREERMNVIDVAVTLGSDPQRRTERWQELAHACGWLGFEVLATTAGGLTRINPLTRQADPQHWRAAVDAVTAILAAERPQIIFAPHRADRHPTHVGTHHLVFDALANLPGPYPRWIVETEYWGQLEEPNLMVGSDIDDVADLVAALACHRGEVARHAYHLALPAGMIDAARRGAELVKGHGAGGPACRFATLYRVSRRTLEGRIEVCRDRRVLTTLSNVSEVFAG